MGDESGREFLAIYIFDPNGKLVEARIDDLGPRTALDRDQARQLLEQRMSELGPFDYVRILVQPFAIERFGTTFGLVPRAPEGENDNWWIELQPGWLSMNRRTAASTIPDKHTVGGLREFFESLRRAPRIRASEPEVSRLHQLAHDVGRHEFSIPIVRTMKLQEVQEAPRLSEKDGLGGKIILIP